MAILLNETFFFNLKIENGLFHKNKLSNHFLNYEIKKLFFVTIKR